MPVDQLLAHYGLPGVIVFLVFREVWPAFRELIPGIAKRSQTEKDRMARMEERQIVAFEKVGQAVQDMAQSQIVVVERLGQLSKSMDDLRAEIKFEVRAVADCLDEHDRAMRERTRPRGAPPKGSADKETRQ